MRAGGTLLKNGSYGLHLSVSSCSWFSHRVFLKRSRLCWAAEDDSEEDISYRLYLY